MELLAWALALVATFCWAAAQVIGKMVLKEVGVVLFNSIRFCVVAPPLLIGALLTGGWGIVGLGELLAAVLSGALGLVCGGLLFFHSLKKGAAHRIIPVGNSYPFWTILFAVLFLSEEIKMFVPISAVLIFLGSFLLSGEKEAESRPVGKGISVVCFVAFLWGLAAVLNKYCLNRGMAVLNLLAITTTVAAISFGVAASLGVGKGIMKGKGRLGLTVLSGILGLLVGEPIYLCALSIEKASTLAPLMGGTIFFGFLLSVLSLKERPTSESILGTALILGGVTLTSI